MNDGVQGGSPAFRHTGKFMEKYGHQWQEVRLQVGFGKGTDNFWTNVFPTHLVEKHQKDIRKFGKVLKIIKYTMPVLGLVPIKYMLKLFWFNKDFGDKMVIPLIALFLGTGKLVNLDTRCFEATRLMLTTLVSRQSNSQCRMCNSREVVRRP
jgi:hypothetical protein